MPINFITNDPNAPGASVKTITPTPDRPATKMSFNVTSLPAMAVYPPNTVNFVAWQAREAALRALITFEKIAGRLVGWTGKATKKKLKLNPDLGEDLNAYYDQESVSFFDYKIGSKILYSGASTDVVAHEVGHGILDSLRPDLWNVNMMEVAAFHEGFGDCVAVMTALSDRPTRVAVLKKNGKLTKANFAEATAEQLSWGIRKVAGPTHNASKPRHALNKFKWAFPSSLPMNGKPEVLINEVHSFGQLTSGCYFELIGEIFRAGPSSQSRLWSACQKATKLLALAVKSAPVKPRFLESVGRAMILADRQQGTSSDGTGLNEAHIRTAFDRHGITLGVSSFLAPRAALGGRAGALSTPGKSTLRSILDAGPNATLATRPFALGRPGSTEVTGYRAVDLSGLSAGLKNVKAYTPQVAIVGHAAGATAVLGSVESSVSVEEEVRDYVATLVQRKLIDFEGPSRESAKRGKARKAAGFVSSSKRPTHVVRRRGKEAVLERLRFGCRCHLCSELEE
ncbi:hypothetical protein G5V57_30405 [Nordella sp. HKS 07]|uniref:M36 family metallopeptidase n=1 Tax=Nordella sp. HKS 07 TaxID=2712222 RepID=UPI0013E1EA5F|nr:M36 family metallopeptidase [Nordella sp. HKS 07]QIG51650.1 hypothetical protein G5V57_30405 [Nordella sp. HKS 07]